MSHDPNQTAAYQPVLSPSSEPVTTELNQLDTTAQTQDFGTGHANSTIAPHGPATSSTVPEIAGYAIEAELGRGGMGVVYKAQQTELHRPVAIKMILGGKYTDPVAQARFMIEAEVIALLTHPRIVQVFGFGRCDEQPFFVLEFVGGGSLAGKLRQRPLTHREAATMVAQLAEGIAAAHQIPTIKRCGCGIPTQVNKCWN